MLTTDQRSQQRLSLVLRLHAGSRSLSELTEDLPFPEAELREVLIELVEQGIVQPVGSTRPGVGRRYQLAPDADRALLEPRPATHALVEDAPGERASWLRKISLFAPLGDDALTELSESAFAVRVEPREKLFLEGETCEGIYIVESGVIKLLKQVGEGADTREQVIRLVAANDFFNEVPVFDGGANPVSAEAMEEAVVLVIPTRSVRRLMQHDPEFVRLVIADLAGRVRHLVAMVQDLSLRQVSGRVAKILLQSVEQTEGVGVGAERHPRMTQRDIAEMAGTVREVVARTLREMERQGAIEMEGGRVVNTNRAKLLELL